MIDIHNHIIYQFDDGPRSLEESLEMLKMASDQGITDVFATSHFSEMVPEELEEDYFQKLEILRREVRDQEIGIRLHSGSEIFFHHYMLETVKQIRVSTLGGLEKYVLMEFPLFLMPTGVEDTLYRLTMEGFIPIVAHPERYSALHNNPRKILNFIKFGGLLQVNAGSVLGEFGRTVKKIAMWLLENQLVHFIGSDAHSPSGGRTFKLLQAAHELEAHLDKAYINALVETNPRCIIDNIKLEKMEIPEAEPEPAGFLSRVRRRIKFI